VPERYESWVDFYRRILGLPAPFSLDNEHSKLTCLDMAGSYLMIEIGGTAVAGGKPIERSPVILRFNAHDVEAMARLLEAPEVSPRISNPSSRWCFSVKNYGATIGSASHSRSCSPL